MTTADRRFTTRPREVDAIHYVSTITNINNIVAMLPAGWVVTENTTNEAGGFLHVVSARRSLYVRDGHWIVVDGESVRTYSQSEFTAAFTPGPLTP